MSTLIKNVVIARVGKIIDGREITLSVLEHCVATFKPEYYQPNVVEFFDDVVHQRQHVARNKGKVKSLTLKDGVLFADLEMYAPIDKTKKIKQYPTICYMKSGKPKTPALMSVILAELPNRNDNLAINRYKMKEV
ncbi:hypothetical protein JMJ85_20090 [Salmonella enterica subsp. diarizonae]|uniref:Uncharacterized protein n=1 Tax=Salmonella diarizonae TaxID=59204 RepID=A0A8F5MZ64_SALDZ|nr:hypothetical protein JMJ85_20090 [Salmonella enterica subsp. diarizonae]